jgi:two-component system chemotaxis response regulator CheY
MRLLTVDDSAIIRKIIRNVTDLLEYSLEEASNGKEALSVVERFNGNIDLILLDWNMPEMNGYEVLEKLKADQRYKNIPVMMVTTEGEKKNIVKAIKAGAVQYVVKPFTIEELTKKIQESLGRGRIHAGI